MKFSYRFWLCSGLFVCFIAIWESKHKLENVWLSVAPSILLTKSLSYVYLSLVKRFQSIRYDCISLVSLKSLLYVSLHLYRTLSIPLFYCTLCVLCICFTLIRLYIRKYNKCTIILLFQVSFFWRVWHGTNYALVFLFYVSINWFDWWFLACCSHNIIFFCFKYFIYK